MTNSILNLIKNVRKNTEEKDKLLVTSNFSFCHSIFKRPVLQTRKNKGLFGKGLKSFVDTLVSFLTGEVIIVSLYENIVVLQMIILRRIKALKVLIEDDPEDFFPIFDITLNSKTLVPLQGGSVVGVSNS